MMKVVVRMIWMRVARIALAKSWLAILPAINVRKTARFQIAEPAIVP